MDILVSFVVINFGRASNDLSPSSYSLMIAVTVVSMTLTPGLFSLAAYIRRVYEDFRTTEPIEVGGQESRERQVGHVVIIGAGFVGRYVGKVLSALDRPYVVIESNYRIAQRLRSRAVSVVFGDARRSEILEAANISDCSLVIITSTNDKILPEIVTQIKGLRSDVPVVVRVEDVEDIKSLASLAVEEIVQPQFEVGLEMVRQAMLALKFGESQVVSLLSQLRIDRYQTRDRYTAL